MSTGRQVARDTGLIVAITLISKVTGFIRTVVQAAVFGANALTDAFVAATVYPNLVFAGINGAITTTFIPLYTEIREQEGRQAAFRYANVVQTALMLALVGIEILGYVSARAVLPLYLPGWVHKTRDGWNLIQLTLELTWVMLPSLIFMGMAGVQTGLLQAEQEFGVPAALGIPQNILIVAAMLTLASRVGIFAAAIGTLAGGMSMLVVQAWPLRRLGYRFRLLWDWDHPQLRRMGRMVLPVFVSTFVGQAGFIVDRILASSLPSGSISALNYASLINNVVLGVFVTALVTVLYPALSRYTARQDLSGFVNVVRRSLGVLTLVTMPVTIGVIVLATPIVRVVYQHGAFTTRATGQTAFALIFFAVGLVASSASTLLPRAFFSLKDTRTPTFYGIAAVGVNIIADLILVHPLRQGGLALGTSLAQWALTGVLLWRLRRRVGPIGGGRLLATTLKSAVAAGCMGIVIAALDTMARHHLAGHRLLWEIAVLGLLGVVGAGIYTGIAWLLRIEEMAYLGSLGHDIWARLKAVRMTST
jgi:putative peptidoglycan lipid II flippase